MHHSGDMKSVGKNAQTAFSQPLNLETAIDSHPLSVPPCLSLLDVINLMNQGVNADASSSRTPDRETAQMTKRSSYALIVSQGQLLGILTERDVVKLTAEGIDCDATAVADVMTQQLITLTVTELKHPSTVLGLFRQHRIRHLPILDGQGQVLGVATPNSIRQTLHFSDLFRLCRVEEVMVTQVIAASPETNVMEIAQLMAIHRVSCVVITQSHASSTATHRIPIGILTERDIVQFQTLGLNLNTLAAQDAMSAPLVCLSPKDSLWDAHQTMSRIQVRRLVVTDAQGALAGIVTQTSVLAALDPLEMQKTISVLQQQITHLQTERMQWLQTHAARLENQVQVSEQRFRAIFNQTFQFIGLLEPDGTLIEVNQTALDFGGLKREEVINQPFWKARCWEDHLETQIQLQQAIAYAAQGEFVRCEIEVPGAERTITIDFSLRPVLDEAGQVKLLIPEGRDISDRKQAEAALRQSEQRYANLAEASPVGIFQTDIHGNCIYVNHRWCQIAGTTIDSAMENGWIQHIHPEDRHLVITKWQWATQSKQPFRLEYRLQTPHKVSWVYGQAIAEIAPNGQVSGYIGTITDITERKQAELKLQQLNQELEVRVAQRTAELEASKERAQVTLHSIADAVITTNASGEIDYLNPVAEQLTGWPAAEAKGKPLMDVFKIIHEITREPAENPIEQVLQVGCITEYTQHALLIARHGAEYSVEDSAAPIRNQADQIIGTVIVFHDVTKSRQLAQQLSWQASHDALTGLANRRQFEQVLAETLQDAQLGDHVHVLCYLDLDQFKVVNDTGGHIAGDELLRQVSRLLQRQIRTTDTLARLGGDEFGIILKRCPLKNAEIVAEKLRKAVQAFRFIWQGNTFRIGTSIGLVALDVNSRTLTEVLSAADSACYAAKAGGRNRVQCYQVDDIELAAQRGERQWSVRIMQALEENRFCLYRQAIRHIHTSHEAQHIHYEILLRMLDEKGNLIYPGSFIPAAERYGLMSKIDRWVVRTFFAHLNQVQQRPDAAQIPLETLHLINLSGASVGDAQFLEFLKNQFNRYAIAPHTVGFEITETTAIANLEQATHLIHELKQLGCYFALDDFGSGMSSFGYLKSLPVDYLKIDGKFIEDIDSDPTAYAMVEAINHVGHVMGLKTVAESVENQCLREKSAQIGVDFIQGYGVALPLPIALS